MNDLNLYITKYYLPIVQFDYRRPLRSPGRGASAAGRDETMKKELDRKCNEDC
ncbi:hypothetical protein [Methanoculleus sp.]|uniref:hypothetical protein n=1 Tax=Methanoculleus sp. TaxID=90427 RepID=UPI0025CE68AF|nr:hypothetical protein [Methanoculleus sp.]MCK9317750.1 hypothetical protein [Methanoculleus sp.]